MAFHDVRLPEHIERGARGGPTFNTSITVLRSGQEARNQNWEFERHEWDISYGIQTRKDSLVVRDFFLARRGQFHTFRYKDWTNYEMKVGVTDVAPVNSGEADPTKQALYAVYADPAGYTYRKRIYLPILSTLRVFQDSSEIEEGFTWNATSYTLDFAEDPTSTNTSFACEFDLPVRFGSDQLPIRVDSFNVLFIGSIPIIEVKL